MTMDLIPFLTTTTGPVRGRRPESELSALRERIETLMLQHLRAPAIHRALTGLENPTPIVISPRQVRVHMRAVERSWGARSTAVTLEADRARTIAATEEAIRIAFARSTRNTASNIGVGYFNAALKAQEQWIRLRGLDAPTRTELSGPDGAPLFFALADHPAEHLDPREEARRLLQMAADRNAEADEAEAASTSSEAVQ
jgi:hypothetical protein